MPKRQQTYNVLVASPDDLAPERELLNDVMAELGILFAAKSVTIRLIRWEDLYPGVGSDPQAVINSQVPQDYDIFVGILWTRFGAPTPRAESGTAEEFEQALARHTNDPSSIRILVYFKDEQISPSSIDPDQLKRVRDFKAGLSERGVLYKQYGTADDFVKLVRIHLMLVIQEWEDALTAHDRVTPSAANASQDSPSVAPTDVPANLDTIAQMVDAAKLKAEESAKHLKLFAATLDEFAFIDSIGELRKLKRAGDVAAAEELALQLAPRLRQFAQNFSTSGEVWLDSRADATTEVGHVIAVLIQSDLFRPHAIKLLKLQVSRAPLFRNVTEKVRALRNDLGSLPLVTDDFTAAKRMLLQSLKNIEAGLDNLARESETLISLLPD